MADAVTDADIEKLRADNDKLRDKIASAYSTQAERQANQQRRIDYTQLQAENAQLQMQLNLAQEAAKSGVVKDAAAGPLAAAQDQLATTQAQAETVSAVPVDPNAGTDSGAGTDTSSTS
jgi:hypothetical protein